MHTILCADIYPIFTRFK